MKQTVTLDHAFRVLKMIERIDSFKTHDTEGWDSYSAKPVDKQAISNAKTACLLMSPESLEHLYPCPSPDGSVQFENSHSEDFYFFVECYANRITIAAQNPSGKNAEYEITFKSNVNWSRDLDFKVCSLFRDALMDEKGIKASLFFVPSQWRTWRTAKKWFKRLTKQSVPTGTKIALAFGDGRLICSETVDEFIKQFEEAMHE